MTKLDISRLSPEERLDLLDELAESLASADETPVEVSAEWAAELDTRLNAFERGELKSIPYEVVKARRAARRG